MRIDSRFRNVHRLACAGALWLLGSAAATAQTTQAVATLNFAGGPNGDTVIDEDSQQNAQSWGLFDADAQVNGGFNAAVAGMAFCSAGSSSGHPWQLRTRVVGGDVLRFKVPGAAPKQVTRIDFRIDSSGSGGPTTSASLAYCIGDRGAACPAPLDPSLVERLALPAARHVKTVAGGHDDTLATDIFIHRRTVTLEIKGPKATVPLWYAFQADCAPQAPDVLTALSQMANVVMTLPPGVQCTSRSGQAFGKCPLR